MVEIAYRVIRLGTALYVVAFETPGGEPLLKRKYPFGGAAIKDDRQTDIPPKQRSSEQQDIPYGTWKTQIPRGLSRGGFRLTIDHETERITLTPISPRSKEPISDEVTYNFTLFGIEDDRTTPIEQAKNRIEYRVRKLE